MTRNLTIARQMVSADLLRLRKKRGFMALVLTVVIAPIVIVTGYNVIRARVRSGGERPCGRPALLRAAARLAGRVHGTRRGGPDRRRGWAQVT